jgi:alanine racemase
MHIHQVDIDQNSLEHNIRQFRALVGPDRLLSVAVKANAYGHGLVASSRIMLKAGVDWLAVNALFEARILRAAGVEAPVYVMGYIPNDDLAEALELDVRFVVYNKETIDQLGEITQTLGKTARVHIKAETGNNRQGVLVDELVSFAQYIQEFDGIEIEGLATHFANIEDTTDHSYAEAQVKRFERLIQELKDVGITIPITHCANSAATILFPHTHFDMVRVGIAAYGMWPSQETLISAREDGRACDLRPILTWKTMVAQVKMIPKDSFIGYGCTHKTTRDTRLAIVPVGYYDGYDRGLSNNAHVLIHGKRAKVIGRVCMNIIMVDVTDILAVRVEDEVVLLGRQGEEVISAEQMGAWIGTINYEITTRINENIPRVVRNYGELTDLEEEGFLVDPVYYRQHIRFERRSFLGRSTVDRLKEAESYLPEGHRLKIFDGFRTLDTQKSLFDDYYVRLSEKHPDWPPSQLYEAASEFVAPPVRDPENPPPHNTGTVVDLTVVDAAGNELDMGTEFDHFTEQAHTQHFEEKKPAIHANRMILKEAMERAGFENYPSEWWHFNTAAHG